MKKTNTQFAYPVVLLASLPLLLLGGCASNDTMKSLIDTSLADTESSQTMQVEQALNEEIHLQAEDVNSEATESVEQAIELAENNSPQVTQNSAEINSAVIGDSAGVTKPQEAIIGFGFDEAIVNSEYGEMLWQHAQYLKANENLILHVSGHTDTSGARAYNEMLSRKRADQVAKVLLDFGAPKDRVKLIATASDQPLVGAVHHRENRRVELEYQDQQIVSN